MPLNNEVNPEKQCATSPTDVFGGCFREEFSCKSNAAGNFKAFGCG